MIKRFGIIVTFLSLYTSLFSQDINYARNVIDTLGSGYMAGRGYIDNGVNKAADYIRSEFINHGLICFGEDYFQSFSLKVNPVSECSFEINGEELIPGIEYVIDAHSASGNWNGKPVIIDETIRTNTSKLAKTSKKANGNILILDMRACAKKEDKDWYYTVAYGNPYGASGVVLVDTNKLSYSVAIYIPILKHFLIEVRGNALPVGKINNAEVRISSSYQPKYPVKNVIGYLQGREQPDSFLIICAHYDHLGKMGQTLFPGANDNGSGTAMMLDIAKKMASERFRPRYSVVFMALAGEETGLNGSTFFVDHPLFSLKKIKFLVNLDMVGTGTKGITVVNGTIYKSQFDRLVALNDSNKYISEVTLRGESCNSDHCPFYKAGVPSFFIYSKGDEYNAYHDPSDKPELIPLSAYEGVFSLVEDFLYSF